LFNGLNHYDGKKIIGNEIVAWLLGLKLENFSLILNGRSMGELTKQTLVGGLYLGGFPQIMVNGYKVINKSTSIIHR
jgi:hypothetical protein